MKNTQLMCMYVYSIRRYIHIQYKWCISRKPFFLSTRKLKKTSRWNHFTTKSSTRHNKISNAYSVCSYPCLFSANYYYYYYYRVLLAIVLLLVLAVLIVLAVLYSNWSICFSKLYWSAAFAKAKQRFLSASERSRYLQPRWQGLFQLLDKYDGK